MVKTTWGRKETIIWPRHMPIYSYAVAFGVALLTFVAVCARIHLATAAAAGYCLPAYERVVGLRHLPEKPQEYLPSAPRRRPQHSTTRPAMNDDVILGKTDFRRERTRSFRSKLSEGSPMIEATLSSFVGRNGAYVDARFSVYLRACRLRRQASFRNSSSPPILAVGVALFLVLAANRHIQGRPAPEKS